MPFEKHVPRLDLNIGTESVTECASEIPASRRSSTLTPDPHYRERIPGGVKPLTAQSTRAWEGCTARTDTSRVCGLVCLTAQPSPGLRMHRGSAGYGKVTLYARFPYR